MSNKRILIVDDDNDLSFIISEMLEFKNLFSQGLIICEFTFDGAKRFGIEHLDIGRISLSDASEKDDIAKMLNEDFREKNKGKCC